MYKNDFRISTKIRKALKGIKTMAGGIDLS